MLLSKKSEYALRAVFELALRNTSRPVKVHEIASAQNIPPRFLEVILNQLRHAGLVESRRGNEGGYMLAHAPQEISVGDVIRPIQGQFSLSADNTTKGQFLRGDYAFEQLWRNLGTALDQICYNTTFASLIEYERAKRSACIPDYTI